MSDDEYTSEMELYGVSPGLITMIMIVVTLLVPFGYIDSNFFTFGSGFYGFFWIFLNPYFFLQVCFLNILFSLKIVRYYQARSPTSTVLLVGLLSLLLPTVAVLYFSWILLGIIVIIYPIPIQFLIGMYLLRRIEGPEVISPWSGMRLDLSWWKWNNPKKKSDWDPIGEEKSLEKEDWLEE